MKNNDLYLFFTKYRLLLIALLLLFCTVVVLQVNYNKNHMHDFHVDEYFTIATIHPSLTPDKTVHRALNGPRVFTYLFYPGALVGMMNHMGGNVFEDGWKYPGHNYFVNNYKTSSSRFKENMADPNFRYFHYYLKLQAVVFMFLTFIPLVFFLWRKKYYVGMFMIATLIGTNFLVLEERSLFYIEPIIMSMMNLLVWMYFYIAEKKQISWLWIIFSAFLFAMTISLKFSAIFLIVLIAAVVVVKFKTLEKRIAASALLILFSLFFFCLINWNIFYSKEVFTAAVHDYFSNFWHYATGHKGEISENFKLSNLKNTVGEVFYSMGGLIFLLPALLFFGLRYVPKKAVLIWVGFISVILVSIGLTVKQQIYVDRNILPFLTALVLITGVMADHIIKHVVKINASEKKLRPIHLYAILAAFIFLPIWGYSKGYIKTIFPSAKANIESAITKIEKKENRRLVTIDYSVGESSDAFKSKKELPSAIMTYGINFKDFVKSSVSQFQENDVVVISEVKNNKQLTNYVLPSIFNTNIQYDKYFVFYNDAEKDKAFQRINESFNSKKAKSIFKDSVAIRGDLILREIKIEKGNKMYFKFDFLAAKMKNWNGCRFYFHGKPFEEDLSKLPEDRIEFGFEGWDFTVNQENTVKHGNSLYIFHEFKPALKKYKEFSLGIFRGCTKSEEFNIKNVTLSE